MQTLLIPQSDDDYLPIMYDCRKLLPLYFFATVLRGGGI